MTAELREVQAAKVCDKNSSNKSLVKAYIFKGKLESHLKESEEKISSLMKTCNEKDDIISETEGKVTAVCKDTELMNTFTKSSVTSREKRRFKPFRKSLQKRQRSTRKLNWGSMRLRIMQRL